MDLAFDLNEALAREGLSLEDIKRLREDLPPGTPEEITDKQLVLFLNACGNDQDYTRKVIEEYYKARKNAPEYFNNRDPTSDQITQAFKTQYYTILPQTEDGYHVIYYSLRDYDASNYYFDNINKATLMLIDACLNIQGPSKGLIIMSDMKGVCFMHTLRNSLSGMRKMFHYMQECLPCKLHKVHVMNASPFYDFFMKISRPFLKPHMLELLNVHKTNVDMEEFFRDCIPKSSVPADYGGDCPSIEELSDNFQKELIGMREYFAWEEGQRCMVKDEKDK